MKNIAVYSGFLKIYKKYSKIALGHGHGGYCAVDALVEFKINNDFIENYIIKSHHIYSPGYFVREDFQKQVDKFVDELVEYTQDRLLTADPDYNNVVDIKWICDDIERLFPMISCVITEIPNIGYTHVPEEPNINIHNTRINEIIEEIEQNEIEM